VEKGLVRKVNIDRVSAQGVKIVVQFPNIDFDGAAPELLSDNYPELDFYPAAGLTVFSGYFTSVEDATKWIKLLTLRVQKTVERAEQLVPQFRQLEGTETIY